MTNKQNINQNLGIMENLNVTEQKILKAIAEAAIEYTGGDFTYFDEIEYPELKENQLKGYVGSLVKKQYIYVSDDEFVQISTGVKLDSFYDV